jgi:hypothetical protein
MSTVAAGHTYAIEERFDKALKLTRAALRAGDLEIVGEMDMPANWPGESPRRPARCRVLLVDCPLLVFEGLALDRAAGVYFPLHVLLASDGVRTQVSTVTASGVFDARLPAGAAEPIDRLEALVARALESLASNKGVKYGRQDASATPDRAGHSG